MLTPRYFSNTIAAGGIVPISCFGRHILIASISASTIELSIQDEAFQQVVEGEHIDCEDRQYSRLMIRNTGLVASTVVMFLSEAKVDLQDVGSLLAGILARLVSIDQEISGGATCTQLASVNVAATGGAGTALFAANTSRCIVSLTARDDNSGLIFIGDAAGNVSHTDYMDIIYPGGNWFEERYKGGIWAVGDDANQWVGGYEV